MFCRLDGKIKTCYTFKLKATSLHRPIINENSSVGEQVKYYRAKTNIRQKELSKKLDLNLCAIKYLENNRIQELDVGVFKKIIDELGVADKIIINDDYLDFVLNDYGSKLVQIRQEKNMTRPEFARFLDVALVSIHRWEQETSMMKRNSFNKIKKRLYSL